MNANKHATTPWVDPDDAPDLSDADWSTATWRIGEREVSPAEGMAAFRAQALAAQQQQAVTIRYSPDVLEAFRASGPGWQERMNEALRDWLRTHSPAQSSPA